MSEIPNMTFLDEPNEPNHMSAHEKMKKRIMIKKIQKAEQEFKSGITSFTS